MSRGLGDVYKRQGQRFVSHLADEVHLARTDFIEGRNISQYRMGKVKAYTLTYENIRTHLGGYIIIGVRVSSRLFLPEFLTGYGGQIKSGVERFDDPPVFQRDAPWDVVLLDSKSQLELVGISGGKISYQKISFPLSPLSVIPSYPQRGYAHPSGILPFNMRWL